MSEQFGSLSKPVTVTISGEMGSGKAMLTGIIATRLNELGAEVFFDVKTSNDKISSAQRKWLADTMEAISEKQKAGALHLTGKPVLVVVEDAGHR